MKFIFAGLVILVSFNASAEQNDIQESPFLLLAPVEWAGDDGGSSKAQAYFSGVLETYGFTLYSYWPRNAKYEQQFSDFRKCVERFPEGYWTLNEWAMGQFLKS